MKRLINLGILLSLSILVQSQTNTTIDYAFESLSTTSCNVFDTVTKVDNIEHLTALGRPRYTDNSILLQCDKNNSTTVKATIYSIKFSFKTGYTYKISVNCKGEIPGGSGFFPYVGLKISDVNGGTDVGTDCSGPPNYSFQNANTFNYGVQSSSYAWSNNLINSTITQNSNYLLIGAFPSNTTSTGNSGSVYIRKIQIIETAPSPSCTPVSGLSLNVPANTCTSGSFSVNNLPTGATVSWSALPANSVSITTNGNNATISNAMNPGGYVNINASVLVNGCTQNVGFNNIYFGSFPTTGSYTAGSTFNPPTTAQSVNYVPPSEVITLTINNAGSINSSAYSIQKVFGDAIVYTLSNNSVQFSLGNYSQNYPGQGTITLSTTANTNCGTINEAFNFTTQGQCGSCYGASAYKVSPNPASNSVVVSAASQTMEGKTTEAKPIYQISIYNNYGRLMKVYKYGGVQQATINVAGLQNGLYLLKISDGKTESSEQLLISR